MSAKLAPDHYIYLNAREAHVFTAVNEAATLKLGSPLFMLFKQSNGEYLLHVSPKQLNRVQVMLQWSVGLHLAKTTADRLTLNQLIAIICTNQQILDIRRQF